MHHKEVSREELIAAIEAALEEYLRQEEQFAVYRGWWKDMLREYKLRRFRTEGADAYPFFQASLTLQSLQKDS